MVFVSSGACFFGEKSVSLSSTNVDVWQRCLTRLRDALPLQQFNTWIRPLKASQAEGGVTLAAPNRFIRDFVEDKYGALIAEVVSEATSPGLAQVVYRCG